MTQEPIKYVVEGSFTLRNNPHAIVLRWWEAQLPQVTKHLDQPDEVKPVEPEVIELEYRKMFLNLKKTGGVFSCNLTRENCTALVDFSEVVFATVKVHPPVPKEPIITYGDN